MFSHYPRIHNLGHPEIANLLVGEVLIEEKVDGSQFNFWVDTTVPYGVRFRSRGREMFPETKDKLFQPAIDYLLSIKPILQPDVIYRGECLAKPKHNTICYARIPKNHIIIFDIDDGNGNYWSHTRKMDEAHRLGFEAVPLLGQGRISNIVELTNELLLRESVLGGASIEGVVIKNYHQFGRDDKPLFGKYVSEAFKEKHRQEWKQANPGKQDILENLITIYRHENRWRKAIQHLTERGELTYSPSDIGKLMQEVQQDVLMEEKDAITQLLWKLYWPKISRGIVRGLPEWYKQYLLTQQHGSTT